MGYPCRLRRGARLQHLLSAEVDGDSPHHRRHGFHPAWHTAKAFVDAGEDVVITYYQTWREPSFIKDEYGKRVIVEKADVSEPSVIEELAKKHKTEHIVHLAVPGVAALGPYEDYRVNMNGLIGVLEAARNAEVKRLSLASSIAVYHSLASGPYRETDRLPVESSNPTETFKKSWEILGLSLRGAHRVGRRLHAHRRHLGAALPLHDEPAQQARSRPPPTARNRTTRAVFPSLRTPAMSAT